MRRRSLSKKVVVLTGASSGIGRATALALAKEGAELHLVARREAQLREVCREAEARGAAAAEAHVLDVCDEQAMASMAAQLRARGGVDVLINNAGVGPLRGFLETTEDDWEWTFDTNVKAVVSGVRLFLPEMLERGRGTIVNIASLAGLIGNALPSYCASKFAVVGLSESLAIEFGGRGIDVIVVCPGLIKTEIVEAATATGRANPEIASTLSKAADTMGVDAELVARDIVAAVRQPRFLVMTPTHAAVLYRAHQTFPGLTRRLLRSLG